MNINIYFGRVVKALRCSHHLSQEGLAEKANLNRTYYGEVERGIATPSLATVAKIAAALNLPTSELIARSEQLSNLDRERQEDLTAVE